MIQQTALPTQTVPELHVSLEYHHYHSGILILQSSPVSVMQLISGTWTPVLAVFIMISSSPVLDFSLIGTLFENAEISCPSFCYIRPQCTCDVSVKCPVNFAEEYRKYRCCDWVVVPPLWPCYGIQSSRVPQSSSSRFSTSKKPSDLNRDFFVLRKPWSVSLGRFIAAWLAVVSISARMLLLSVHRTAAENENFLVWESTEQHTFLNTVNVHSTDN